MLLYICTYVFGLTIWYWTPSSELFPWEDYFSHCQRPLVACDFVWGCGPMGLISIHFSMSVVIVLVQRRSGQSHWWDFLGVASDISRKQSHSKLPAPLALTVSPPLLPKWSPSLMCRSCVVHVSTGTGLHNAMFWLVVVFGSALCCKRRSPVSLVRSEDYT